MCPPWVNNQPPASDRPPAFLACSRPRPRRLQQAAAPGRTDQPEYGHACQLESLPGIGASKAAAIIANRPYQTVDDLERVPGIGTATIGRLRPLVTVN